jgi:hypothetical protein
MNNDELDQMLKSACVPERGEDFWNAFPSSVTMALRRRVETDSREASSQVRHRKWTYAAWGVGLAAACLVACFALGVWRGANGEGSSGATADARKYYREIERLFPNQVRAIVFDRQGAHLVLADRADVPGSPALFVKICGINGCERVVTFSGQQIQFEGEKYEVLADEKGGVILVGDKRVWAGGMASGPVKIEAQVL